MSELPELPEGLTSALEKRVPVYNPDSSRLGRIAEFEEFLLESANVQADLREERIKWERRHWRVEQHWVQIPVTDTKARTDKAVTEARARAAPEIHAQKQGIAWIIQLISQEIDRLESDASKVSRALTAELAV